MQEEESVINNMVLKPRPFKEPKKKEVQGFRGWTKVEP